jgi:glycosyltransferase involved in cell wall biosynthesis
VADDLAAALAQSAVSVVVPTRNRRRLLQDTVHSVLRQRDVEVQVVVVDDGSEDDTVAWLATHRDPRVTVVDNGGRGVASARNAGIDRADRPLVAFCDDDDLWAPDKLALQLEAMRAGSAAWSATGAVSIRGNDLRPLLPDHPPRSGDLQDLLLARNRISGGASSVVVLRSLLLEVGGFDPSLSTAADWDCWIRLAVAPIATVDLPLVANRLGTGNMSSDVGRSRREVCAIADTYADLRSDRGISISWDDFHRHWAACALRAHDRSAAAELHYRLGRSGATGVARTVGLIGASILWPGLQRRRDERSRSALPPTWLDALGWLDCLDVDPTMDVPVTATATAPAPRPTLDVRNSA